MKILYATTCNIADQNVWSGSVYYIYQALKQNVEVELFDKVPFEVPPSLRFLHQYYKLLSNKTHLLQLEPAILKKAARRIESEMLKKKCDAVFCPGTGVPINTFINSSIPVFTYLDATKKSWISTYFGLDSINKRSNRILDFIDSHAIQNNTLTILSSDWAMQGAIEETNCDKNKLSVIPFGGNLPSVPTYDEVSYSIERRSKSVYKMLFVGKEWKRKGGSKAFSLVKTLRAMGINAELTIIGCIPEIEHEIPAWVKTYGFIDRSSKSGLDEFQRIISEAHFILFFSSAEAYGLALCEANAFGVPAVANNVGGIPTIVKNGINGYVYDPSTDVQRIAAHVFNILENKDLYKHLALSARSEYDNRLNWSVAGKRLYGVLSST